MFLLDWLAVKSQQEILLVEKERQTSLVHLGKRTGVTENRSQTHLNSNRNTDLLRFSQTTEPRSWEPKRNMWQTIWQFQRDIKILHLTFPAAVESDRKCI